MRLGPAKPVSRHANGQTSPMNTDGARWWVIPIALIASCAAAGVSLQAADIPSGFWKSTHGQLQHVGLIIACICAVALTTLYFAAVVPIQRGSAKTNLQRAQLLESLQTMIAFTADDSVKGYCRQVSQYVQDRAKPTPEGLPLSVKEMDAAGYVLKSRRFRGDIYKFVDRYSFGKAWAASNRDWRADEDIVVNALEQDGKPLFENWGPGGTLTRTMAVWPIRNNQGEPLAMVTMSAPIAASSELGRLQKAIMGYSLTAGSNLRDLR
jgi:hypothetical protein